MIYLIPSFETNFTVAYEKTLTVQVSQKDAIVAEVC